MIKKLSLATILALSLGTALHAENSYVELGIGISDISSDMKNGNNIDYDNSHLFTLAVGHNIDAFAVELEFGYDKTDWHNKATDVKGNGKSKSLMINGYYNIDINSKFTPYVGVGVGSLNFDDGYSDDTDVAYQAMLGTKYNLNEKFDISLEYRYKDVSFDTLDLSSNNLIIGTFYKF